MKAPASPEPGAGSGNGAGQQAASTGTAAPGGSGAQPPHSTLPGAAAHQRGVWDNVSGEVASKSIQADTSQLFDGGLDTFVAVEDFSLDNPAGTAVAVGSADDADDDVDFLEYDGPASRVPASRVPINFAAGPVAAKIAKAATADGALGASAAYGDDPTAPVRNALLKQLEEVNRQIKEAEESAAAFDFDAELDLLS